MFGYELNKAMLKQRGLFFLIIVFFAEIIMINAEHPGIKFRDDATLLHYYEYAINLTGKLTPKKEKYILSEQKLITDAKNAEYAIEVRLRNGEYSTREEYLSEYQGIREITEREEAFNLFLEKYNYAKSSVHNRYITLGEYSGLGRDFPDIIFLAFTVFMTSTMFLSEESSNMIVLVKTSSNGRKMLWGKVLSLLGMLILVEIFRIITEILTMTSQGNLSELKFPIQSIPYFQGCPYKFSIIQVFLASETLRFLGILFVAALIILFSVTIRKPIFTVFVPSAFCLLQQYFFNPATGAYCIPTGLLRAVGYFRGNAFETLYAGSTEEKTVQTFSEIPFVFLVVIVAFTVLFIGSAILTAIKYYSKGKEDAR